MVKRFCTLIMANVIVCLLSFSAWAVPGLINYQGKLTDAFGSALHGTFQMVLYLYDAQSEGTLLWSESHDAVEVTNGIFDLQLGSVESLSEGLFDNDNLYLEVEIDGETLSPRQQITSTAFAIKASDANMLGGQAPSYYAVANHTHDDLKPAHEWSGTSLRFENPDGTWGDYVDLKGDTGATGPQGIKGDKGDTGPSSLIDGYKEASFDKIRDCCGSRINPSGVIDGDCITWPFSDEACRHLICDEANMLWWGVNEFNYLGNIVYSNSGDCP